MNRRSFLKTAAVSAVGITAAEMFDALPQAEAQVAPNKAFEIAKIERVTVKVPFRETPQRNMFREIPHWMYSEIFTVTLKSGHV